MFLGIISTLNQKKKKLHSKRRLRSINVRNAGQCDHLLFGQPKILLCIYYRESVLG